MEQEKYLKRKQVCELLNVTPTTIRAWERSGKIAVDHKVNGRARYTQETVKALMKKPQINS